ncbi:MAG: hypothetical protein ACLSCQ_00715 [Evtepia gabavorous]
MAVLHSCLSTGERYDEWKRVRDGQASVVIGTRSAVFAPLADVGLMILDEEQESSYQSESMVRYHAREVAKFRCTHHKDCFCWGRRPRRWRAGMPRRWDSITCLPSGSDTMPTRCRKCAWWI